MLQRVWRTAAWLAVLAVGGLALSGLGAEEKKKEQTIKGIMGKAHKGGNSILAKAKGDLKGEKWDDLAKKAKELQALGTSLGKLTPPKGEKDSWEKLTGDYVAAVKSLEEAAVKKDKGDADAAMKKVTTLCGACHSHHKGK